MLTLLFVFLCSCTSKSGQLINGNIPILSSSVEKIVVIDRVFYAIDYNNGDTIYKYKVKRIDKGVVDFVDLDYPFDTNDTIMYQFWNK